MLLFIKGLIIGIGKIIPGVSGAMLAINFNVYERLLDAITNFFDNPKTNLKFLFKLGSGIILSIVLCSSLILFLMNHYKFITMMFFIGLITGGTYNFSKQIKYNYKNIIVIFIINILLIYFSINNINNIYILKNNFLDNIMYFLGGYLDTFASIVPGISGTSLLMMIGIYNHILLMISQIFNFNYIINNINIYLSYGTGIFLSFIINSYLINYLIKKHQNTVYTFIFGLSISSIIILLLITIKIKFNIIEFLLGVVLLFVGLLISSILDK